MQFEAQRENLVFKAKSDAADYLKSGKVGGEFEDAVAAFIDNEGAYDIIAMLLIGSPLEAVREKMEAIAFSDFRLERESQRNDCIVYQNRADARRHEAMGA